MSTPLVLTFDVGTQSTRALLVNPNGDILMKVQKKYNPPYISPQPNWAEQDANYYWDAICETSLALKEKCPELWGDIIAVTSTVFRDSCVCIDKDGNTLRNLIVWLDKRESTCNESLPFSKEVIFRLVRMRDAVDLQRRTSACNWIMEFEPELWKKTYKFLFLSTYVNLKLCGNIVDTKANMIGHIPYDYKNGCWQNEGGLSRVCFDIPNEKLCDLVDPGEQLGVITEESSKLTGIKAGLPLIGTGSDKGCETLGLSCLTPEKAAISLGTSATLQVMTDHYVEPQLFAPAYPAVIKDHFNPEIQIYRGYWLISWFKNEFAHKEVLEAERLGISAEELLNSRLHEIPAGCEGLMIQPYFTPGVVRPKAKGSMIGFSDNHTRIHIYRAIIEGINFALMDGLYTLERRAKIKIKEIYVGGGGSQSDEICQIAANQFGLPVYRIQTHESCGLGSSMIAFVTMGVFKDYDEAIKSMVHIQDEFRPDMHEHKTYKRLYHDIFKRIFGRLNPLYKKYK